MSRFTRRKFLGSSAAVPLGLGFTAGASAQSQSAAARADLVVTGANIITMDYDQPSAEAIAVRGSRILAIGSNEDVLQFVGPNTEKIDAAGMTMTPGFIDAHSHPLMADSATGSPSMPVAAPTASTLREPAIRAGSWLTISL